MEETAELIPLKKIGIQKLEYSIEELVNATKSASSVEVQLLLNNFCMNLLEYLGVNHDKVRSPIEEIFYDWGLKSHDQRFIAGCFLRLLKMEHPIINDLINLRINIFKLFDNVLGDLYKTLKIDTHEQNYEKEKKLINGIVELETELNQIVKDVSSIRELNGTKQQLLRKLRYPVAQIVMTPFLPEEIGTPKINEIFRVTEELANSKIDLVFYNYQVAMKTLKNVIDISKKHQTFYSKLIYADLFQKLLEKIEDYFSDTPVSKPAKLVVRATEKKYPLLKKDEKFNLTVVVQNEGPGWARDVRFKLEALENVEVIEHEKYIGTLSPISTVQGVKCRVAQPEEFALFNVTIQWINANGQSNNNTFELEVRAQRSDIDWEILIGEEPYNLEPISSEDELIGRHEILQKLLARTKGPNVRSSYVYGQKRVGKTSIVKALKSSLKRMFPKDYIVIYLESGDYIHADAENTIASLGNRLCKEILNADPRFAVLQLPEFKEASSPLSNFLEDICRLAPELKILFVLDEFDELPLELFNREPIGNAFFLTIRSISGKESFGFILVGGEKMEFILSSQGDKLNKFQSVRVDYFNKEENMADFKELVRSPVAPWLEISEEALDELYELTSGNPYFTKLICGSLFNLMVRNRDTHVTRAEIQKAKDLVLSELTATSFQHFWWDGIIDTGARAEEISVNRRKILVSFGEIVKQDNNVSKELLIERAVRFGIPAHIVEAEIRDLIRRQVLCEINGIYKCNPMLFQEWLQQQGTKEILTQVNDQTMMEQEMKLDEAAQLTPEEIVKLTERLGTYQGRKITTDEVRMWLKQFGSNKNQRLMFSILQRVRYYSADVIRQKMKDIHGIVIRGLVQKIQEGKRKATKREDIMVSYLDGVGKSGAECAKLYADENAIPSKNNVIERGKLRQLLEKNQGISAIVFVDDILGTGNTACEYIRSLNDDCGDLIRSGRYRVFLFAICGLVEAKEKLVKQIDELNLTIDVHLCDPLDNTDKCFSEESKFFSDYSDKQMAKKIASDNGYNLVKSDPLGHGNCQLAVVFEWNCPNNSLPIFWKEQKNWFPLFKRQTN
ncbi:MAG: ATP-binding protein [Carboxydocellales bacterium]